MPSGKRGGIHPDFAGANNDYIERCHLCENDLSELAPVNIRIKTQVQFC